MSREVSCSTQYPRQSVTEARSQSTDCGKPRQDSTSDLKSLDHGLCSHQVLCPGLSLSDHQLQLKSKCCSLDLECPLKVHVLKAQFPRYDDQEVTEALKGVLVGNPLVIKDMPSKRIVRSYPIPPLL